VLATLALLFTARVVCEQTLLAWTRGDEMAEFSARQSGLDWVGILCLVVAVGRAIAAIVWSLLRRSRVSAVERWLIVLIIVCCGLWWMPHEQWKRLLLRMNGTQHMPRSWAITAAASGEVSLLHYMINNGADLNERAQFGETPLSAAAAAGQLEATQLLIAHGVRLENRTSVSLETPLTEAAQQNHAAIVKLLLAHGADANAKSAMGMTALDWARRNRNVELIGVIQGQDRN
jgi:hypothetical protein